MSVLKELLLPAAGGSGSEGCRCRMRVNRPRAPLPQRAGRRRRRLGMHMVALAWWRVQVATLVPRRDTACGAFKVAGRRECLMESEERRVRAMNARSGRTAPGSVHRLPRESKHQAMRCSHGASCGSGLHPQAGTIDLAQGIGTPTCFSATSCSPDGWIRPGSRVGLSGPRRRLPVESLGAPLAAWHI